MNKAWKTAGRKPSELSPVLFEQLRLHQRPGRAAGVTGAAIRASGGGREMSDKRDPFGEEFVEMLRDIGGIKPLPKPPHWDGKTPCPYCSMRFESLFALDHHVEFVHGDHE